MEIVIAAVAAWLSGLAACFVVGSLTGGIALLAVAAASLVPWVICAILMIAAVAVWSRLGPNWPPLLTAAALLPIAAVPLVLVLRGWGAPFKMSLADGTATLFLVVFAVASFIFVYTLRRLSDSDLV